MTFNYKYTYFQIRVNCVVADAPAKSGIKLIMGHAAAISCSYCTVKVSFYLLVSNIIINYYYCNLYKYFACVFVCMSVCPFVSNKRQNGVTDWAKFI